MGRWTITGVVPQFRQESIGPNMGHEFIVTLNLRHTAVPAESSDLYAEMPRLVWRERITYKDYNTQQYWAWGDVDSTRKFSFSDVHQGDLYAYRPDSLSFKVWRRRYFYA